MAASRRHARVRAEAEDLAHDLIVAALRRGLPLESERFAHAVESSARRHAAFVARSAARRRTRELLYAGEAEVTAGEGVAENEGAPVALLPSALHTTLLLLSLGHTRPELRCALGITDAALRKRLQGLRQRAPLARPQFFERWGSPSALRRTQVGVLAQLSPPVVAGRGGGRLIASSDPDGHGIIFSEALTNGGASATSHAASALDWVTRRS